MEWVLLTKIKTFETTGLILSEFGCGRKREKSSLQNIRVSAYSEFPSFVLVFFPFWFEQLLLLWLARRSLKQEKYLTVMVIYMNTALMGNSMNGLCNFIFFLFPSAQIQIFFCFDEMLLVQIMIEHKKVGSPRRLFISYK